MKKKKTAIILTSTAAVIAAAAVLIIDPRFHIGDRIHMDINVVENDQMTDVSGLTYSCVYNRTTEQQCHTEFDDSAAKLSIAGGEYGGYAVTIDGTERPVEIQLAHANWYDLTDIDIFIDIDHGKCSYHYKTNELSAQMQHGEAELEDGTYVINLNSLHM